MSSIRFPLLVAFSLAVLLSMVNVTALQSGSVRNDAVINVVSSDSSSAFLHIQPGTGNAVNQTTMTGNGILQVDFRKGFGSNIFTLNKQRTVLGTLAADNLRFKQVFTITNHSDYCIDVGVAVPSAGPGHLLGIYGNRNGTPATLATTAGAAAGTMNLGVAAPNNQVSVDFEWSASSGVSTTGPLSIQITSQRTATCPP